MSARQFGKSWWIDFRFDLRRYRLRSPENSSAGAKVYEATIRAALARGDRSVLEPRALEPSAHVERIPTFAEFAKRWFATYVVANNKPSEIDTKRKVLHAHLVPAFGPRPLDAVTTEDVERYKTRILESGRSRKTLNNQLTILRRMLATAVEWNVIQTAPRIRALPWKLPRIDVLDDDDVRLLLAGPHTPPWSDMARLALGTGLRRGELLVLQWEDIDLRNRTLTVQRNLSANVVSTPKNHGIRTLPLTDEIVEMLSGLQSTSDLVFHDIDGRRLNEKTAWNALRRVASSAGIRPIGWHVLRHTFATKLVRRGCPIHVVKELLGHSTIEMTMRYVHATGRDLIDAVRFLESDRDAQPAPTPPAALVGNRWAMPSSPPTRLGVALEAYRSN